MSLQEFVPTPRFEEYRERFKDFYKMTRREDGVLLVEAHTMGGPVQLSVENHRSLGQMLKTVGADPENEILILTGSGDEFMMGSDPEGFALEEADMEYWAYEYAYKDGRINVSSLVNDLEIPTIGLMNGPGFHSEIVLMCDITLAAEGATIFDLHYDIGSVPADGIHNAFQELLGVKRAAYALLTGEAISARQALEWGMVNEVVPRERLIPRAYEIADHIMTPAADGATADHADRAAPVEAADRERPRRRVRHPDVRPYRQKARRPPRAAHPVDRRLRPAGPQEQLRPRPRLRLTACLHGASGTRWLGGRRRPARGPGADAAGRGREGSA